MAKLNEWLVRPQRRLGALGLLILLVMASLVAPLSLDMYTPAVPGMAAYFDTTPETVNFTLVGYYLFLAVGLLVFGPLSDKYEDGVPCSSRGWRPTAHRASRARLLLQ